MIKLFCPKDEIQLIILKSLFEAEGIPIFVHNDNYGSLKPGIQIELLNTKTILVSESYLERAQEVIKHYLGNIEASDGATDENDIGYSIWDKARMVFEGILCGWVMPGKRWPKNKSS